MRCDLSITPQMWPPSTRITGGVGIYIKLQTMQNNVVVKIGSSGTPRSPQTTCSLGLCTNPETWHCASIRSEETGSSSRDSGRVRFGTYQRRTGLHSSGVASQIPRAACRGWRHGVASASQGEMRETRRRHVASQLRPRTSAEGPG